VRPKWFLRLWWIRYILCTYLALKLTLSPNEPKRDSIWHTSSMSSIGCIQIDSKHMVRSMQTMQLSYIKISTISEKTKSSFHLSSFTYEYHRVHPKWFRSLRCIRCKPCTYLAPKLTLSPNRLKRDSIWHTSSRSSIECIQIDFQAYGMFHANRLPILHQD